MFVNNKMGNKKAWKMNKIIIFIREHKSVILFIIGLLIAAFAFFHSVYIEEKIKK